MKYNRAERIIATVAAIGIVASLSISARANDTEPATDSVVDGSPTNVIAPDQPGYAFSSQTVGAGRFEFETSLERDVDGGDYRAWLAPTLLRYGLTDNLEARLASSTYTLYDGQFGTHAAGWNDVNLGVKYHLPSSGQNGAPSIGFLLNAAVPSGSHVFRGSGVRPALAMSAEWSLPQNYSLALAPGLVYDNAGNGRYVGGLFAVALGKDIGQAAHVFVELAAPRIAPRSDGGTSYSFDVGYTYRLAPNTQVDVGANFGLNKQTPDVQMAFGFSQRW